MIEETKKEVEKEVEKEVAKEVEKETPKEVQKESKKKVKSETKRLLTKPIIPQGMPKSGRVWKQKEIKRFEISFYLI